MPTFDIVSEYNAHEITNAVDQANREVDTRFDFKGSDAKFIFEKESIKMQAESDFQLKQMLDIIEKKLTKRGVNLAHLKVEEPNVQHKKAEQMITLKQGVDAELGKKIIKTIKDHKMKVQSSMQGDQVRVSGKSRDDLQEVIALLRATDLGMPLQFTNFRD